MTTFQELSNQMADVVQTAAASLVTVLGARPVSGTVVGPEQVLTAAHVLHTDELTVRTADGQDLPATVVGRDPSSDLALLRVVGLQAPALAASQGTRVGELLLAVGRPPHGVQVTLGLMEHAQTKRDPGRGWLTSGAAPFPGISGGALVDARGGLVGVLNAGLRRGTLLAVPAERALQVAGLLATAGRVPRGYLGIATQPVHLPEVGDAEEAQHGGWPERGGPRGSGEYGRGRDPRGREAWGRGPWGPHRGGPGERRGRLGLTVVQVEAGSPAEAAGLRVGDILLTLGGESIRHPGELLERVRDHGDGGLSARLLRGGEELDVTLTVGER